MQDSKESSAKKPRLLARGAFFQRRDDNAPTLNSYEMGYSVSEFYRTLEAAHRSVEIIFKTPIYHITEFIIEFSTAYERRSGLFSTQTHVLVLSKYYSLALVKKDSRLQQIGEESLKLVLHAFWLCTILPETCHQPVLANLVSLIYYGKPTKTANENYSFMSFFQDCQQLPHKDREQLRFFYDCLEKFNTTLTRYEKETLTISTDSEAILKHESEKNFYFIKNYSMLLMGITDISLRRLALQTVLEQYCDELQSTKIVIL